MLNGKSSMFVRLQGSSSMADTLKVGKNKKFKTATHEFAHTFSQSDEKIDAEFWKEIKSVKNKYNRALTKIDKAELVEHTMTASEAAAAKSKIFISDYGNTTVDEFLAEAFAQARLAESTSPFSVEVLNIVDKYFKKSTAKKVVENSVKSSTIVVHKSLGAAAKNYQVKLADSKQHTKLAENQKIEGKVFASKGTDSEIRDRFRLESDYHIPADEWGKVSGKGYVIVDGKKRLAELHWYEAEGEIYEIKVKRYLDES